MSIPKHIDTQSPIVEHPGVLKRHIVIDNDNKVVYIQVMRAFGGTPISKEWNDINEGRYYLYLPADARDSIIREVRNGYKVIPVVFEGHTNRDFYMLQINQLTTDKAIVIP